jgi:hypothetical protein
LILFTDTQEVDTVEEKHTLVGFHALVVATVQDNETPQFLESVIHFRDTDDAFA